MIIRPKYITLKNWAGNLQIDYPNENLPVLLDENKWEEWATIVASTGIFARAAIPNPFSLVAGRKMAKFETWQEWAEVVYNKMSAEYDIDKN